MDGQTEGHVGRLTGRQRTDPYTNKTANIQTSALKSLWNTSRICLAGPQSYSFAEKVIPMCGVYPPEELACMKCPYVLYSPGSPSSH